MNKRKYRVKKVEWENVTYYYPQRKGLFFWKNYYKDNYALRGYMISFHNEVEAWNYIQNHKPWPVITYNYE